MLGGMKTFSCKSALPLGYQTVQTMDPKELEFPQESHAEKKRAGSASQQGRFVTQCGTLAGKTWRQEPRQ